MEMPGNEEIKQEETQKREDVKNNYADSRYMRESLNDYERYSINSIIDNDRPKLDNCLGSKKPRVDFFVNNHGTTLLHYVCGKKDIGTYHHTDGGMPGALIRYGFSPEAKDDSGLTPVDYARIRGHTRTVAWIENHLKKQQEKKEAATGKAHENHSS